MLSADAILYISGALLAFIGSYWIIAIARREPAGWKYTVAFVPLVNIIYGVARWSRCKVPLLLMVLGIVLLVLGAWMMWQLPPQAPPA